MVHRLKATIVTVLYWYVACYLTAVVCGDSNWTDSYRAIQNSMSGDQYDFVVRIEIGWSWTIIVVTAPATLFSLWLIERFTARTMRWRRLAVAFAVWEIGLLIVGIGASKHGLAFAINEALRMMFDLPAPNSIANLVLFDLLAILICTMPVATAVLWWYSAPTTIPAGAALG